MEDVVKRSGLDKNIFYDLKGNHDSFGVPVVGGSFDFFLKYSINGQLGRRGNVNCVTAETGERKHLFVGLDTTMPVGLRGPTNLFEHPTDQLVTQIDSQLLQWDSQSNKPVTKISFGHFPLSFSASSHSGKSLKNIFLNHSISAYLCGHLHTSFGKNLKRHHQSRQNFLSLQKGDWRKSRAMRIMAIDRGHVSYLDVDFKSGPKKTIVLPTFPLDSRFVSTFSWHQKYECQHMFSVSPIVSVVARTYDVRPGTLNIVMETPMTKLVGDTPRGDFYEATWNNKAFDDPSPNRFWLQMEAIEIMGRSTLTGLRPLSVYGLTARISWTWKEFLVIVNGLPRITQYSGLVLLFSKKQYSYKSFIVEKGLLNGIAWALQDLCRLLILFTDGGDMGYMTYMGWVARSSNNNKTHEYIGSPDIMVVVLPHLLVVLPVILVAGKKEDDDSSQMNKKSKIFGKQGDRRPKFYFGHRLIRKVLLVLCLGICCKHFMNCRALKKAFEMNLFHFPVFSLAIPLLLAYTAYKTTRIQ
ncbi:hypothetical protein P3X46_017451 [Hevea brasiliensis]|uniref:Calcineurin-like phosphoesterase domain-containing protein n=1 Tax=Hevea brasiliensis TaxID=3981 RepID=A0ABQ9LRT8_HEVBR|nr:hypothetical protein P3X46_017451 [Hevea brasiliensis]